MLCDGRRKGPIVARLGQVRFSEKNVDENGAGATDAEQIEHLRALGYLGDGDS